MARTKLLLLGAAVLGAAAYLKRDKVTALLPSRTETPAYTPPATGPSNYDAPGPVTNTATAVPVPEAHEPPAVDEAAEEAAAAAEAANIGGTVSDYAGPADLPATEAERPLAEAGEGEAEGQEQAELDLEQAAEPSEGMSPSQHAIEDAIEDAGNPLAGERLEEQPTEPSGWEPPSPDRPAGEPAPFEAKDSGEKDDKESDEKDDNDSEREPIDWSTWSGRSVEP
ncbi:MAG TPA: hypothetical protein VFP78_22360 [Solirubrobacteraceae bacterium]|nr:hypothetical protein [Solirubrobacteraceae bacterium]